jgi:hypothetical protein
MENDATVTANFGDKCVRLARLVRVAIRADFVEEFGPAGISARDEQAIAAGDYLVVRKVVQGREGRDKVIHRSALGQCATCRGTGRIDSSCDPYGIAPCPTCRPMNPKEGA